MCARRTHLLAACLVLLVFAFGAALAAAGALLRGAGQDRLPISTAPTAGDVDSLGVTNAAETGGTAGNESAADEPGGPDSLLLTTGRAVYVRHCAGCHGQTGDGNGPAARFLFPRPRDFTSGWFKFASTPSGSLPTDEDLLRSVRRGLPGSAMPCWTLLSDDDSSAVVEYLKSLSPRWDDPYNHGDPIPISANPLAGYEPGGADYPAALAELEERGRFVYHAVATCWECHPSYVDEEPLAKLLRKQDRPPPGRAKLDQPEPKYSEEYRQVIRPTDFVRDPLKVGSEPEDLFRVIAAGVSGTAMPTWYGGLPGDDPNRDLWALAYYVKKLAAARNRAE